MGIQPSYTNRRREFDYLELHWLEKTTGRPRHEWDLYILKELLDNALDADEPWAQEKGEPIEIGIDLHYYAPIEDTQPLEISVTNCARFPVEMLPDIFDLSAYTSNKSHYNYPSRGQQGNALKTILGIRYALRREYYADYGNLLKPLVIETGGREYVIRFEIDERRQVARVAEPIRARPLDMPRRGTAVRVTVDHFEQEMPRTIADLREWALRFAVHNPHVTFSWSVQVEDQEDAWDFRADQDWKGLFRDTPPVWWYEYTQLRELLLALERKGGSDAPLADALRNFAGFSLNEDPSGLRADALCEEIGLETLGDLDLMKNHALTLRAKLLPELQSRGRKVPAEQLGGLGEQWVSGTLAAMFNLEAPPLYRRVVHDDLADPSHPFVLELALAQLPPGAKRTVWTALNHSPTYEDPFYTRRLYPPRDQGGGVFGLDGFMDAYGLTEETPALLMMHLICPNLAFQDFSKTTIETRPFREPLTAALHDLLTTHTAIRIEQTEDLQPVTHSLIPEAIGRVSSQGRRKFALVQLLSAVRRLLEQKLYSEGRAESAKAWFSEPGAETRMRGYVNSYMQSNPDAFANLIQPDQGWLSLPDHPQGYVTLLLNRVNQKVLESACVNKILLVPDYDMEDVIIANGLLARFDMAILRNERDFSSAFNTLLQHLGRIDMPLAILHHATASDYMLIDELRARLSDIELYDLGLTPSQGQVLGLFAEPGRGCDRTLLSRHLGEEDIVFLVDQNLEMSLHSMTMDMLVSWLDERFKSHGLGSKFVPDDDELRIDALRVMKGVLSDWIYIRVREAVRADYLADQVMHLLSPDLKADSFPDELMAALHEQPLEPWRNIGQELAKKRCEEVLLNRHDEVEELMREYGLQIVDNKV